MEVQIVRAEIVLVLGYLLKSEAQSMRSAAALLLCMPRHKWNPIQSGGMRRQRLEHRETYNNMHEHKRWHEEGRTGEGN